MMRLYMGPEPACDGERDAVARTSFTSVRSRTRAWPFNKQASTSKHRTATSRPYITQRPSSSPLVEFSRRQGPRGWPSLATSRRPDTVVGCAGAWLSGHSARRCGLGRRLNPPGRGTHYLLLLADRRTLSLQAWAACGTSGPVTRHGQSWSRLWRSFLKGFGQFGRVVGRGGGDVSPCGLRSGWYVSSPFVFRSSLTSSSPSSAEQRSRLPPGRRRLSPWTSTRIQRAIGESLA